MKASNVDFFQNHIIITSHKSPLFTRIPILILAILCALLPLISLVLRLKEGLGLHIVYVPIFLVCGAATYFFIKILLWNTYGKEILQLHKSTIVYTPDYKYFKGKSFTISRNENTHFSYVNKEKDVYLFTIEDETESIENVLPITIYHARKLQNIIEKN